jgi:hypothetical protein
MQSNVNPVSGTFLTDGSLGRDHYRDYEVDGGYQFLGDGTYIVTVNGGLLVQEHLWPDGLLAEPGGSRRSGALYDRIRPHQQRERQTEQQFVHRRGRLAAVFDKDDSWLRPFANPKLGIQYTAYTQSNGASKNYDGFGNASANNTLFIFAWMAF